MHAISRVLSSIRLEAVGGRSFLYGRCRHRPGAYELFGRPCGRTLYLHPGKGFAVSPPVFDPRPGLGSAPDLIHARWVRPPLPFGMGRLCSHLWPYGRQALPATLLHFSMGVSGLSSPAPEGRRDRLHAPTGALYHRNRALGRSIEKVTKRLYFARFCGLTIDDVLWYNDSVL